MKIVVLAGGYSTERDVSLSSGSLVANALLDAGHEVVMADAYCGVDASVPPETLFRRLPCPKYAFQVPEEAPDLGQLQAKHSHRGLLGPGILPLCQAADVVFIGLHGAMGENGQLQAVLDVHGIRYTGSGYEGCLLAMNKELTKQLLRGTDVDTPEGLCIAAGKDAVEPESLTYPVFVKPCRGGSSVGAFRVDTPEALRSAISGAAVYEETLLIERMVSGREFSVGVLEGKALPVIEICPDAAFYDYARKYQAGSTVEICPACLSEEETARMQRQAETVFRTLGLRDYARIDFIREENGHFVCLEANNLPGMTPTSLLPQEAAAAGIPYQVLCCRLVELALQHEQMPGV